jgi:hypothetical protein
MSTTTITFNDYSNEKSAVTYHAAELTAANFDAEATEAGALSVATNALSIGSLVKRTISQMEIDNPGTPTNPYAQRELKWLVSYRGDTSGKLFQVEIPCANVTDNLVPNTDIADITSTSWENYITAFEAYARSPDDPTETVTFEGARLVGRNL